MAFLRVHVYYPDDVCVGFCNKAMRHAPCTIQCSCHSVAAYMSGRKARNSLKMLEKSASSLIAY